MDGSGMYSAGSGQFQPPNLQGYQYQGDATNDGRLASLCDQATGGTINAYNTAANRLRERLDSSTQGQADQTTNRNLGRGFANSGAQGARPI